MRRPRPPLAGVAVLAAFLAGEQAAAEPRAGPSCSLAVRAHVLAGGKGWAGIGRALRDHGVRKVDFVPARPAEAVWEAAARHLPLDTGSEPPHREGRYVEGADGGFVTALKGHRAQARKYLSIFRGWQELLRRAALEPGPTLLLEEDAQLRPDFCQELRHLLDAEARGLVRWGDVAWLGSCSSGDRDRDLAMQTLRGKPEAGISPLRLVNASSPTAIHCPTALLVTPRGAAAARNLLKKWPSEYVRGAFAACGVSVHTMAGTRPLRAGRDCWLAIRYGPDVALGGLFRSRQLEGVLVEPALAWQRWQERPTAPGGRVQSRR